MTPEKDWLPIDENTPADVPVRVGRWDENVYSKGPEWVTEIAVARRTRKDWFGRVYVETVRDRFDNWTHYKLLPPPPRD